MRVAGSFGADQDQLCRMLGMTRGVRLRDDAAERITQDNRFGNPERLAEGAYLVAPLREIPAFLRSGIPAPVAAVVEVDDLRNIRQRRVSGLVERMVEPGTAMQQQERRLLAHDRSVRHKLGALDIE